MTYEYEGKNEKEAIENAVADLGLERDQFDVEIIESQKKSLFKSGYVKIRVHTDDTVANVPTGEDVESSGSERFGKVAPAPQGDFEEKLVTFVREVITRMGYTVSVDVMFREDKKIGIRLSSANSSILIGRKGKNLDALQLLANVYAGHLGREDVRVILDTENYRVRREENIVHLAYTTADKVRSTKMSVLLEPMNPFERRLVHTTLNDIPDIETKSEGDGLFKQVRVIYKGNY